MNKAQATHRLASLVHLAEELFKHQGQKYGKIIDGDLLILTTPDRNTLTFKIVEGTQKGEFLIRGTSKIGVTPLKMYVYTYDNNFTMD